MSTWHAMTEEEEEVAAILVALCPPLTTRTVVYLDAAPGRKEGAAYHGFTDTWHFHLPADWKETVYDQGIALPDEDHLTLRAGRVTCPAGADGAWQVTLWRLLITKPGPAPYYLIRYADSLHYGSSGAEALMRMVAEAVAADLSGELPF